MLACDSRSPSRGISTQKVLHADREHVEAVALENRLVPIQCSSFRNKDGTFHQPRFESALFPFGFDQRFSADSAASLARSAFSNATLMLLSIFWPLVKGVFVTMRSCRRLWPEYLRRPRLLASKRVDHRTGDVGRGETLFEQTIYDSRFFFERTALQRRLNSFEE